MAAARQSASKGRFDASRARKTVPEDRLIQRPFSRVQDL